MLNTSSLTHSERAKWYARVLVAIFCAYVALASAAPLLADDSKPDPAGTSTGDRSNVQDAAGNPFVVPPPPCTV